MPLRSALLASLALLAAPAAVQTAPPPPASRADPAKVDLRPAYIVEEGYGPVVVFVSDTFRMSAPREPQPLDMVAIPRSNEGDAFNSPKTDLDALAPYFKANPGFGAKDMVAIASSRDVLRVYFHGFEGPPRPAPNYRHATLAKAPPGTWARLRAIGIPDFALYIARRGALEASTARQIFGPRVPPAEQLGFELKLTIAAAADRTTALAAALRAKRLDKVELAVSPGSTAGTIEVRAHFLFSEATVQRVMTEVCADAARSAAECVAWSAHLDTVHLSL